MRKQLLTVLMPALVVVLTASAQTQSAGTDAPRHAAVQKVNVLHTGDGVSVEIKSRGAVKPRMSTLDNPARIVVDLPNTILATSGGRIAVGSEGVKGVRMGTDGKAMTRVVVDLDGPRKFALVPGPGQKLTLKIGETSSPQVAAAAKVPVVAETQPKVPASQEVAKTSAQDFVVLSPAYAPKKETSDPQDKAVNAASKFVERPAGSLLPEASGSLQASQSGGAATATPSSFPPMGARSCSRRTAAMRSTCGRSPPRAGRGAAGRHGKTPKVPAMT